MKVRGNTKEDRCFERSQSEQGRKSDPKIKTEIHVDICHQPNIQNIEFLLSSACSTIDLRDTF